MVKTILFDLDGTLLPMDQDVFLKGYLGRMAKKMIHYGYDPDRLVKMIWTGTGAMVKNTGEVTNETLFWKLFAKEFGEEKQKDMPIFEDFYQKEFQEVQHDCGFDPRAQEVIQEIKAMGYQVALATNPLFPAVATQSRARWAGLEPEDFALITTYENSRFSKPNPEYYREILAKLNRNPEECVMVGNDVSEDMIARDLGMQVFLLTDCIINKGNADIEQYPHGSFPELIEFIRGL